MEWFPTELYSMGEKCFGIVEGFKAYKVDALSWLDIIINKLSESFIN